MNMKKLLIASNNKNKLKELMSLFADLPISITSLKDQGIEHEVAETGTTFEENAILKAREYARLSGLVTLADDSGIEVDALDGKPGVYSARYSGEGATDEQNWQKLLEELKSVPKEKRTARYRVVLAIAKPNGEVETCAGSLEGVITESPQGEGGFGYDPVFYIPQFNATAAEVDQEQKNKVSHRREALTKALEIIEKLL
jgi:XTP/dITP diphosphohydrolase